MPRAVFCEICGQMFFPASLKIHQKSCKERQSKTIMECPHCELEMPQAELDEHLKKCKKALAAREQGGSLSNGARRGVDAGNSVTSRLPDGRVRCQFCGRGFAANRVQQHSSICGKLKQARPRGRDGTATQVPEKVYDAATADFAKRESLDQAKPCAFGTPKPATSRATQPGSAKKSPEESMWESACPTSAGHSPSSEARSARPKAAKSVPAAVESGPVDDSDPEGWRAKHREFIDAIRTARRTKTTSPAEEVSQVVRAAPVAVEAACVPESPVIAGRSQEASAEVLDVPTPPAVKNFMAQQEKSAAQRPKGSIAKAAAAHDRRRLQAQRPQRPQPQALASAAELDWEVMSAGAEVLSPKSVGAPAGQSLSPVLRRASAPSSSTPTGSSHAGYPLSPSSNDPFSPGRDDEDRESVRVTGDWTPGERVQVNGLLNARDLNGQMAVLLDYDLDASCWLVRLENGVVKAMRSEHMFSAPVPSKPPSVADTPEPTQGSVRSPSPGSRSAAVAAAAPAAAAAAAAVRGPSPPKRQSKTIRPSASVGPRRLKASQAAELAQEPASAANSRASGARPPKAPRSSSAEPRRAPCDSPRPRRSEYANEVMGSRLAEAVRGGKLSSASPEDDTGSLKEQPVGISRSMRTRKTQEAPRACSKAASVPYISSVPEDASASMLMPPQTPKEKSPFRGFAASRSASKAVAGLAGLPEGSGCEQLGEGSPRQERRCPSESPRVTGNAPEAMDSPVPPMDSPLAGKGVQLSENTDGIDERHLAGEPPLSGRAETASTTAAGARTSGSFETGSSTPLSARNLVPAATIHLAATPGATWSTPVPVPSGQGSSLGGTTGGPGFAPAAASTAPTALQVQPHVAFAQHSRATLPTAPAWLGARPATTGSLEAIVNARASSRQFHTPTMTPTAPSVGHPQGQPVHGVMAPHPPASLCLFGSTQLPTAHQLQQAAVCARSTQVQQPYSLSSPVMRTQPRRAA